MNSLDDDKLKECKIIFDFFDKDKDAKISIKELGDCLRVCGAAPKQQELEIIIQTLEENGDIYVSFENFLIIFEKLLQNQDIINQFKKIDKFDNGTISEEDLRHLMSSYENALSFEEIEEIMQEANADKDGYINIEIFTKKLLGNM